MRSLPTLRFSLYMYNLVHAYMYSVYTFSLVAFALSSFKLVFSVSTFGVSDVCVDKIYNVCVHKKERKTEREREREREVAYPESFITPLNHLSIVLQLLKCKST